MAQQMTATSREEMTRINRRFVEIFNSGDVDALDEVVAANYVDHDPTPGQAADREGLKQWLRRSREAFSDVSFSVEDEIVEGDKVCVRSRFSGRHTGEFQGMPPTNRTVSAQSIDILRIENGKAVEHWGIVDAAGMMQQLGMMPMPGQSPDR
jgi:steroid delta-isomerase-like uncharacterized protein